MVQDRPAAMHSNLNKKAPSPVQEERATFLSFPNNGSERVEEPVAHG
jgi:hypothetical protein